MYPSCARRSLPLEAEGVLMGGGAETAAGYPSAAADTNTLTCFSVELRLTPSDPSCVGAHTDTQTAAHSDMCSRLCHTVTTENLSCVQSQ